MQAFKAMVEILQCAYHKVVLEGVFLKFCLPATPIPPFSVWKHNMGYIPLQHVVRMACYTT